MDQHWPDSKLDGNHPRLVTFSRVQNGCGATACHRCDFKVILALIKIKDVNVRLTDGSF